MAPGANCPLVVRFCPKALGQHQASLSVQVLSEHANKVIAALPFKALGLCRQLGEHRGGTLPGGPLALPETFAKPRQFVDPDKVFVLFYVYGCHGKSVMSAAERWTCLHKAVRHAVSNL